MKRLGVIFIFLAAALALTSAGAVSDDYPLRRYSPSVQLPSRIISVYQSPRGCYWFGTEEGLVRHDNYTSRRYGFNPQDNTSLAGSKVYQVIEDESGNTWVLTDRGVSLWNPSTDSFNRAGIRAFSALTDGRGCYFGTTDTLFRYAYSTGEMEVAATFSPGTEFSVRAMFHWQDDSILLFDTESGVFLFTPSSGTLEKVGSLQGRATSLFVDSQGNVWRSLFGRGVECYNRDFVRTRFFDITNSELGGNTVLCFCESDGEIWMGTDGHGISIYNSENQSFSTIQSPTAVSMYSPRDGLVCVGTADSGAILIGGRKPSILRLPEDECQLQKVGLPDGRELCYNYPEGFFTTDGRPFSFGYGPLETENTEVVQRLSAGPSGCIFIHNENQLFLYEPSKKEVTEFRIPKEVTGQGAICQSSYGPRGKYFHNSRYIFTPDREGCTVRTIFDIGLGRRINGISSGPNDTLWIASSAGFGFYDLGEESFHLMENEFIPNASKVLSDVFGNIRIETGGKPVIYCPADDSFFIIDDLDTEIIEENETNLMMELRTVETAEGMTRIAMEFDVRSAQYNYAARQFRFLIEGPRGEIVVCSDSPQLKLVSPCPGRYRIYGSCSTKNARWTDFTLLTEFKVRARWYLSWWLVSLLVVLAFAGAYAAYKWAVRCYVVEEDEEKRKTETHGESPEESKPSGVTPCSPIEFPLERPGTKEQSKKKR